MNPDFADFPSLASRIEAYLAISGAEIHDYILQGVHKKRSQLLLAYRHRTATKRSNLGIAT